MPKIFILLIGITLAAWGFLIDQQQQMPQMSMANETMPFDAAQPWQLNDFIVVYVMWSVMIAAMMLPSALPMIQMFNKISRQRYGKGFLFSLIFSLAYLSVWLLFSVVLTVVQWKFHDYQWLSGRMGHTNDVVAGFLLILAGGYQFTKFKNVCLKYCRSPAGFLLNSWQNGRAGAFAMGFKHGIICVGCCWAQMLIMFVVGVMNITAMVWVTLYILLEKSLPKRESIMRIASGVLLCLWGSWLLFVSYK